MPSDEFIERLVLRFKFLGYNNLDQILDLMRTFGGDISEFANKWVTQRDIKQFNAGVSLMYLLYICLGRQGDPEKINKFARQFGLGKDVENFAGLLIGMSLTSPCSRLAERSRLMGSRWES